MKFSLMIFKQPMIKRPDTEPSSLRLHPKELETKLIANTPVF